MDSGMLTRLQTLRFEELVGELAGAEEIPVEVEEDLAEVMGAYDVGEG